MRAASVIGARARAGVLALRDFLRGFLGLPGAPGNGSTPRGDAAAAQRALEERAARWPTCC
ncbi:MAG: hypothetical protein OZ948_19765 [Deltaproteobacteria bacterium]|nr:hypothetical protein [Deltaproteobacteria bacterium]